ncbi:hypothetical protein RHGRI_000556 [Rhododendron griersonianum]|uniref:Uncharacterized protein n=1 Tax=Rhododendron griersonianum TaxID=479676 RepID=A0AAV6LJX0_9ERIC|nr:hypothetical protein RHGRI_000556 [Rhododendron griersonianum]
MSNTCGDPKATQPPPSTFEEEDSEPETETLRGRKAMLGGVEAEEISKMQMVLYDCTCQGCRVAEEIETGEKEEDADSAFEAHNLNKVDLIDTNSVAHCADVEKSQKEFVQVEKDTDRDKVDEHADSSNELSIGRETEPPLAIIDTVLGNNKIIKDMACEEHLWDSRLPLGNDTVQEGSATDTPAMDSQGTGAITPSLILGQELGAGLFKAWIGHKKSISLACSPSKSLLDRENSWSIVPYNKQSVGNCSVQPSIIPTSPSLSPQKQVNQVGNSNVESGKTKKKKNLVEILGYPIQSLPAKNRGGRKKKNKSVVFRAAATAIALSVSTEGISNRNRILLNESQAVW